MGTVRYTVLDGEIHSENRNGVERDYVPDPLGSTVALYDDTQTKTDTFDYWPYGEVRSRTGTTPTPFQFVGTRGYYRDVISRSLARRRYLTPQTGRWMTADPLAYVPAIRFVSGGGFLGFLPQRVGLARIPGDYRLPIGGQRMGLAAGPLGSLSLPERLNLYRYGLGSPASFLDPTGLSIWGVIAACGVGLVGGFLGGGGPFHGLDCLATCNALGGCFSAILSVVFTAVCAEAGPWAGCCGGLAGAVGSFGTSYVCSLVCCGNISNAPTWPCALIAGVITSLAGCAAGYAEAEGMLEELRLWLIGVVSDFLGASLVAGCDAVKQW